MKQSAKSNDLFDAVISHFVRRGYERGIKACHASVKAVVFSVALSGVGIGTIEDQSWLQGNSGSIDDNVSHMRNRKSSQSVKRKRT